VTDRIFRRPAHLSPGATAGLGRHRQQLIAIRFYVLAAYIGIEAIRALVAGDHPQASWVGIDLAAVTAPTMPLHGPSTGSATRLGRAPPSAKAPRTWKAHTCPWRCWLGWERTPCLAGGGQIP
jgi:hypothetical protein